jgi:hypothetical protein
MTTKTTNRTGRLWFGILVLAMCVSGTAMAATVSSERSFFDETGATEQQTYTVDVPLLVKITTTFDGSFSLWAAEDVMPAGWDYVVDSASNGGVFNEADRKISWTVTGNPEAEVTYKVTPGGTGTVAFDGGITGGFGGGEVVYGTFPNSVLPEFRLPEITSSMDPADDELSTAQGALSSQVLTINNSGDFIATFDEVGSPDPASIDNVAFRVIRADGTEPPWAVPGTATDLNSPTFDGANDGWLTINISNPANPTQNSVNGFDHDFNIAVVKENNQVMVTISWDVPAGFVTADSVFLVQIRADENAGPSAVGSTFEEIVTWATNIKPNLAPALAGDIVLAGGANTDDDIDNVDVIASDADEPDAEITFNYEWSIDGAGVGTDFVVGTQEGDDWTAEIPGLPANTPGFEKNAFIELSVTPENNQSGASTAGHTTVGNYLPEITGTAAISSDPDPAVYNSTLTANLLEVLVVDLDEDDGTDDLIRVYKWQRQVQGAGDFLPITDKERAYITPGDLPARADKFDRSDVFRYEVSVTDGDDTSTFVTSEPVTIQNSPPVADDKTLFIEQGAETVKSIFGSATDPDGDTEFEFALVAANGGAAQGTVTIDADTGEITYTVTTETEFEDDIVTYKVDDKADGTDLATVTVSYKTNEPPVIEMVTPNLGGEHVAVPAEPAVAEVNVAAANAPMTVDLSVKATDIEDETHLNTGTDPNIFSIVWAVDGVDAEDQPTMDQSDSDSVSSSFTFSTAMTTTYETVDHPNTYRIVPVTATITDEEGGARVATFNITVTDVDRVPDAPTIAIQPDAPKTQDSLDVDLVEQVADPDGDAITYTTTWTSGIARDIIAGSNLNHFETKKKEVWTATVTADTAPYQDGVVSSDDATDSVTILNTPAVAVDATNESGDEDDELVITLDAIDPDISADNDLIDDGVEDLTFALVDLPTADQGTVTLDGGDATFIPALHFNTDGGAPVTFTFSVVDNDFVARDAHIGTVTIYVIGQDDNPEAANGAVFTLANKDGSGNSVMIYTVLKPGDKTHITADDPDADDTPTNLVYTIESLPAKGTLYLVSNGEVVAQVNDELTDVHSLRFEPDDGANGSDSFTFRATDNNGDFDIGEVRITIGTPQWYPPLNWTAPNLAEPDNRIPDFYQLTITDGADFTLENVFRDIDPTNNFVTVQPEFYITAGSTGLLPGEYTFSWQFFNGETFQDGPDNTGTEEVDNYGPPTVVTDLDVSSPELQAIERNRIFTFTPENAAGWILVIEKWVDDAWELFLTRSETLVRDVSIDPLPAFPLNILVENTLFFAEPGDYRAKVRGFNPLAPQPAADVEDPHGDLFSEYSATFTIGPPDDPDAIVELPAPVGLVSELVGPNGQQAVRLRWDGTTSKFRVLIRSIDTGKILVNPDRVITGTTLMIDGAALAKLFKGTTVLPAGAYEWTVAAFDGTQSHSAWARVATPGGGKTLPRFVVSGALDDGRPGPLRDLTVAVGVVDAGDVELTFTAFADLAFPIDSVVVEVGDGRKGGTREKFEIIFDNRDESRVGVISVPVAAGTYFYRGRAVAAGIDGPPTKVETIVLQAPPEDATVSVESDSVTIDLPNNFGATDGDIIDYQIAISGASGTFLGTAQAFNGTIVVEHTVGQPVATPGTYYQRTRTNGVVGRWTDWIQYIVAAGP